MPDVLLHIAMRTLRSKPDQCGVSRTAVNRSSLTRRQADADIVRIMNGSQLVTGTHSPTGTLLGDATPGLSGFSLEFLNGDHKIGWIGVGARSYDGSGGVSADDFLLMFSDRHYGLTESEDGDPIEMWARYSDVEPLGRPGDDPPPGYRPEGPRQRLIVGGRGRGTTRVEMPALPRDMLFVLCGFGFKISGSNHNILALEVAQPLRRIH